VIELLHQAALVPLVVALIYGRRCPVPHRLLALAFAVSWVGDSLAHYASGSFMPSYFWLPVQFTLALAAFPPAQGVRLSWGLLMLATMMGLAVFSAALSAPGPDLLLTIVGSVVLLAVARLDLRLPVFLYFGFGTVCYVLMMSSRGYDGYLPAWALYQGARMAAFAAFLVILIRHREET
jgi:hypothetical protein